MIIKVKHVDSIEISIKFDSSKEKAKEKSQQDSQPTIEDLLRLIQKITKK